MGTARVLEETARKVLAARRPGLLILAELSCVTLAGEDLKATAGAIGAWFPSPVVAAVSRRLARDCADAFGSVLCGIAAGLPEEAFSRGLAADRVALLGYFFDRHEGDRTGDVAVLREMLGALGLKLEAPWLSGAGMAELSAAAGASVILACPRGGAGPACSPPAPGPGWSRWTSRSGWEAPPRGCGGSAPPSAARAPPSATSARSWTGWSRGWNGSSAVSWRAAGPPCAPLRSGSGDWSLSWIWNWGWRSGWPFPAGAASRTAASSMRTTRRGKSTRAWRPCARASRVRAAGAWIWSSAVPGKTQRPRP